MIDKDKKKSSPEEGISLTEALSILNKRNRGKTVGEIIKGETKRRKGQKKKT